MENMRKMILGVRLGQRFEVGARFSCKLQNDLTNLVEFGPGRDMISLDTFLTNLLRPNDVHGWRASHQKASKCDTDQ